MALTTLENVVVTVGGETQTVSLTIEEDGLVVGTYGKLAWAGAEMTAAVGAEGCSLNVVSAAGAASTFFLPVGSFAAAGGPGMMKAFMALLARSAAAAGARVVQPAAT